MPFLAYLLTASAEPKEAFDNMITIFPSSLSVSKLANGRANAGTKVDYPVHIKDDDFHLFDNC